MSNKDISLSDIPTKFRDFAHANGINLDQPDDFLCWLNCWSDGFMKGKSLINSENYQRGYNDACERAVSLIEEDNQT